MKSSFTHLFVIFALFFTLGLSSTSVAQPAPEPPSGHGLEGNQSPAGVPLDGGLLILLSMGIGYGGIKLRKASNHKLSD